MSKSAALLMALTLFGLVTANALIACPFLQASLDATEQPCCPKSHPKPACPLSQSQDDCPFYITEAKIGVAKDTVQITAAVLATAPSVLPLPGLAAASRTLRDRLQNASDLYIHNRVLLI